MRSPLAKRTIQPCEHEATKTTYSLGLEHTLGRSAEAAALEDHAASQTAFHTNQTKGSNMLANRNSCRNTARRPHQTDEGNSMQAMNNRRSARWHHRIKTVSRSATGLAVAATLLASGVMASPASAAAKCTGTVVSIDAEDYPGKIIYTFTFDSGCTQVRTVQAGYGGDDWTSLADDFGWVYNP
jgi:hypothetical protein